jgi:hypothetical protein
LSDDYLFTVEQLVRAIKKVTKPNLRVELVVIGFSRTQDWHSFNHIFAYIFPAETKRVYERWGNLSFIVPEHSSALNPKP